jgi:LacI family transcriptional regulator
MPHSEPYLLNKIDLYMHWKFDFPTVCRPLNMSFRYVHRPVAYSRSHTVGLLVPDMTEPFFAEIILAIEERLGAEAFITLVGHTAENTEKEERLLKKMHEFPPDGVLICPVMGSALLTTIRYPGGGPALVAFGRRALGLDYVGVDEAEGAQLAVEHFYQLGHRRIAFIGGDPNAAIVRERMEGYQLALARRGLQFDTTLVIPSAPTPRGGHDSVQTLLRMRQRPTAALCFNDFVAFGVIKALQLSNLKVGADFGVIGFNNIPAAAQSLPGLISVDTSPHRLGITAAELLLRRIERPHLAIQTVILRPRLIVRESCQSP